jgi:hypothetical protein
VADRVEQVRLAQPHPAVDEERVVGLGRQLGHRLAGGLGELVGGAHDERVEGVARIESLGGPDDGGPPGRCRRRRIVRCRRDRVVDHDRHARLAAQGLERRLSEGVEVMLGEPVTRESIGGADADVVALDRQEATRSYPRIDHGGGKLLGR